MSEKDWSWPVSQIPDRNLNSGLSRIGCRGADQSMKTLCGSVVVMHDL